MNIQITSNANIDIEEIIAVYPYIQVNGERRWFTIEEYIQEIQQAIDELRKRGKQVYSVTPLWDYVVITYGTKKNSD